MSLEVTFLGHQGWSVATATSHILIDPLLTPQFGHGGLAGEVYPPRVLEMERMRPVDAVFVTHEHDDHFDLASLARIDRRVPVYLSCRSSRAAHAAVASMGFAVRSLPVAAVTKLGDLRYQTFAPEHVPRAQGDEWDVAPFVIHEHGGGGWFASSVDVGLPRALVSALSGAGAGLLGMAHNTTNADVFDATPGRTPVQTDDTGPLATVLARRIDALGEAGAEPQGVWIAGGGWAYGGERAWLNHRVFGVEPSTLARATEAKCAPWVAAPCPGDRVQVDERGLTRLPGPSAFVRAESPEHWPDRTPQGAARLETYAPACGVRRLGTAEAEALLEELSDLARFLYGGRLFRELHSMPSDPHVAMALRLLDAGGDVCVVYDPAGCRFIRVACDDPISTYVSGIECWGTDLHALLTGRIAVSALCYAGRLRTWNHDPACVRASQSLLWTLAHPLRRPETSAALYERLIQQHRLTPIDVPGPGEP